MILGRNRKKNSGFTLVELMIVVAIIGVLAAIAIPAFSRYVKKSRTAEASGHINKMWAGSVSYFEADHVNAAGVTQPKQFPGNVAADVAAETAAGRCCVATGNEGGKCAGNNATYQTSPGWIALNFSIADAHNYVPFYQSAGTANASVFTATATGDLDCDGTLSSFIRAGGVNTSGDVWSATGTRIVNEIE